MGLKTGCCVCNIGHFDNEIDVDFLRKFDWLKIKEGVHKVMRSDNDYILLLAEGRLVNLALATGHPSRIMDGSFCNQVLAQMFLFKKGFAYKKEDKEVYLKVMPKQLDEEVAALMVQGFNGVVTKLSEDQANYLNIDIDGPFKHEKYTY